VAGNDTTGAMGLLELVELLEMAEPEFRNRFQGTSVMRAKYSGMQRNACVALGNLGQAQAVPALSRALLDGSELLRSHAAWALGRIGTPEALEALTEAQCRESDTDVLEEIGAALADAASPSPPALSRANFIEHPRQRREVSTASDLTFSLKEKGPSR
jgi:HEAT repeat protein